MELFRLVAVLAFAVCLTSCYQRRMQLVSISSVTNAYHGPFYVSTRLHGKNTGLSVEEISVRWKVQKLGQSNVATGINTIKLMDPTLEDILITCSLSKVGGLGLDLAEFNVGKQDTGLVLVSGIKEGSNADKCGRFMVGDALQSIASADGSLQRSLEGYNFDTTLDILDEFSNVNDVIITVRRGICVCKSCYIS